MMQVPLLSGLSSQQISLLCSAMKQVRAEAGKPILIADRPSTFYIVEAGTCAVIDNGKVTL